MKAAWKLAIGKATFQGGPSSPWTREGCTQDCTRVDADEGWRETPVGTAVSAPIPSEIR